MQSRLMGALLITAACLNELNHILRKRLKVKR